MPLSPMSFASPLTKKLALTAGALAIAVATGIGLAGTASARAHGAASLQCSQEANAKGLHGEARRAFRRHCIHEAIHESRARIEHRRHLANAHRRMKHETSAAQVHKKDAKSIGETPRTGKST